MNLSGLVATGLNTAYPNAIIYSSTDPFWLGLSNWGINAFNAFKDSILYYGFGSLTWGVITKFAVFFLIMLGVAFFASLIFGSWFGSVGGFESRLSSLLSKKK